MEALAGGVDLRELAAGIANSEEARSKLFERFLEGATLSQASVAMREMSLSLQADDVMNAIANVCEALTQRAPTYREVAQLFESMIRGGSLARAISTIAGSKERHPACSQPENDSLENFSEFIVTIYLRCLGRRPSDGEIVQWFQQHTAGLSHRTLVHIIDNSDEAKSFRDDATQVLETLGCGSFVQLIYEMLLGRGASPREINHFTTAIESGATSRQKMLTDFFAQAARTALDSSDGEITNEPSEALLFGRGCVLTIKRWKERAAELDSKDEKLAVPTFARFMFTTTEAPLVSIITSLYKGGQFINNFLENITDQSIFEESCELLIFDAASPDGELEKAKIFLDRFKNIHYKRYDQRIGIYEAWNLGVREAKGKYCTNANLDDVRRHDSLELQAATLEALPFVDVVYQDVAYSFSANLPFSEFERYGFTSQLPIVSRYNLLEFNMPHNGPMWRKQLHEDIGLFNATLKSAGDFEFWIRCLVAGKIFYKINDASVGYFVNPEGLSTRRDTRGFEEANSITKAFNRQLVSPNLTMRKGDFAAKVADLAGQAVPSGTRYAMAQSALRQISIVSRGHENQG